MPTKRRKYGSAPEVSVYDVFTPTTQARLNFVQRESVNDLLVDALRTPGKQIIVYGESGSGKSTLLQRKLEELYESHITTRCSSSSTFASILLDAFDQLDKYYTESTKVGATKSFKAGLARDIAGFRASAEAQSGSSSETTQKRTLDPQLTVQRLAIALGVEGMCWVIEDFHKVPADEKTPLAQAFKIFSDMAAEYSDVKIVSVGATDTARDVVEYDPEMRYRVSEIRVPLMNTEELNEVIQNGKQLMNVEITDASQLIVKFSTGLASVCHHLCLNACLAGGVYVTSREKVNLGEEELRRAVQRYVDESSDTIKAAFDRALRRHRVRKYDNCRLILTALAEAPLEGQLGNEILGEIRRAHPDYPQSNLTSYLQQLSTAERGTVLRHGVDGRYRFTDPIYHAYAQAVLIPEKELNKGRFLLDIFNSLEISIRDTFTLSSDETSS